jgi:hypothetical protein
MKVIKGDISIIPNRLSHYSLFVDNDEQWESYGFDFNSETVFVQVWIVDDEEDEWHYRTIPGVTQIPRVFFPDHLPIEFFDGKKEGDVIIHTLPNGNEIHLTLKQDSYRYVGRGNFNELLDSLKAVYNSDYGTDF